MRPTSLVESGRGPTKALPRPHIAILNIVGVIALLDELVVRGSVRAREGFVLRSAELQPTYVAMSFLSFSFLSVIGLLSRLVFFCSCSFSSFLFLSSSYLSISFCFRFTLRLEI